MKNQSKKTAAKPSKDQSKKTAVKPYLNVPCSAMAVNLEDAGKFYEFQDAVKSVKAYFNEPDTPSPTDMKHLYGHTFGINKLRELLLNIEDHNNKVQEGGKLLKGVRVYYGLDKRDDADFPLPKTKMFRDLIFMPVFEDGVDLYPIIGGLVNPNLILSGSRPCPPQCPSLCFTSHV